MEELKQMAKKKEPTNGELMAKEIIAKYKPKTVEDMQNALKDIFGPMFEAMLNGEMDNHLGYASNDHGAKTTENRRNGYIFLRGLFCQSLSSSNTLSVMSDIFSAESEKP